jgi:DnaK suppressor protein
MTKKFLEKIKRDLEKGRRLLENQLARFAKKDIKPKGDWDTKFPEFSDEMSGRDEEDIAKKREEYEKLLPVEFALEKRLKNINLALEKIKKGTYGICEKCGQKISSERLKVLPEARFCIKCQTKIE